MEILQYGDRFPSPGKTFTYEVIGPICRLFDRETLEYPHCRIEWKDSRGSGKAPSWRRQGRRLVADIAARKYPSYAVQIVGGKDIIHLTLFGSELDQEFQDWWYSKTPYLRRIDQGQVDSLAA